MSSTIHPPIKHKRSPLSSTLKGERPKKSQRKVDPLRKKSNLKDPNRSVKTTAKRLIRFRDMSRSPLRPHNTKKSPSFAAKGPTQSAKKQVECEAQKEEQLDKDLTDPILIKYSDIGKQLKTEESGVKRFVTQVGGQPGYVVDIRGCCIDAYLKTSKEDEEHRWSPDDIIEYGRKVFCSAYERVWVGQDVKHKGFKGATILIECKNKENEYLFINRDIYGFKTLAKIESFYSPKGNSGVPYAYAVDTHNRAYLIGIDLGCKSGPSIPVIEKRVDWTQKDPFEYYDFKVKKQEVTIKAKRVQNHKLS